MNEQFSSGRSNTYYHSKFSWPAVFAGSLVGLGLCFLLNLLGLSIGLTAIPDTSTGMATLATGGFIAMLIGSIISMFGLGWVAGYLAFPRTRNGWLGVLHGFIAWCLALLILALLSGHIGQIFKDQSQFTSNPMMTSYTTSTNKIDQTSSPISREDRDRREGTDVSTVKPSSKEMGKTGLGIFTLFLLGALASCLGGYLGYRTNVEGDYRPRRSTVDRDDEDYRIRRTTVDKDDKDDYRLRRTTLDKDIKKDNF